MLVLCAAISFIQHLGFSGDNRVNFDEANLSVCLGSLAEVELPIDSTTKKIKGFAHITYMFPEHAVLAFNQLDGTTFKVSLFFFVGGSNLL